MDLFDSIIGLEQEYSREGRTAGEEQGRKDGWEAGFKEGKECGYVLASELANIRGFVETWCSIDADASPRLVKLAESLVELIKAFPCDSNIYEEGDMLKIRSKFKLFLKLSGCSNWFAGQSIEMSW